MHAVYGANNVSCGGGALRVLRSPNWIIFPCLFSCADNAGVMVNEKGELKGSAITGPVAKECADIWPRIASQAGTII